MTKMRNHMRLWRDTSLPDGLDLLRASCFDYRYPLHFHDEFVIAAFTRGAQRHWVSRCEGVAEAGTVMIIQPGEVHSGEAAQREHGWEYCAFYPSASFLERIAEDVLGGSGGVDFGRDVVRHDRDITRRLLDAHTVVASTPDTLEKQCAAYDAFGSLIARYGQRTGRGSRPAPLDASVEQAVAFLDAHHDRQVSVSEVAATVGLSEYHFMRTFQAKSGLTVHRYLTQLRLNRAKTLLARGVSAAETALSVGFFDQSHLINQFRRHFGVTPGAFAQASR